MFVVEAQACLPKASLGFFRVVVFSRHKVEPLPQRGYGLIELPYITNNNNSGKTFKKFPHSFKSYGSEKQIVHNAYPQLNIFSHSFSNDSDTSDDSDNCSLLIAY